MTNLITANRSVGSRALTGLRFSAAVTACLAFTACGNIAEKITEEGAERIIEAEGGGNVELDFDSDDGSFSVQTEDGSFALDEDGNFVVTDQDGAVVTGSANDDGIVVTDENGDQVLNVDSNNGEVTMEGEDGQNVFRATDGVPAEWPSEFPRPASLDIEAGSYIAADGEVLMTVNGEAPGDAIEYVDGYITAVIAAGMTQTSDFNSSADGANSSNYILENDDWTMQIAGYSEGETNNVSITLVSKTN